MAYCRCDEKCKVYMYQTFTGYMFHISNDIVLKDQNAKHDFLIVNPYAALRKLKRLKTQGFGVPQYAIARLMFDIKSS